MDILNLLKNFIPNNNSQQESPIQENKVTNQSLGYPENFVDEKKANSNISQNNNMNNNLFNNFQLSNLLSLINNKDGITNLLSNLTSNSNNNIIKSFSSFLNKPQKKEQVDDIPVHKSVEDVEID